MPLLHRSTAEHRPATPSAPVPQLHRELEGIPLEHFPIWNDTIGYERGQIHFLLLPEYWERGLLRPTAEGYTYETKERLVCANIYCKRYTDAMQARSRSPSTGHAAAEASSVPIEYEISNHPDDNPIQLWDPASYNPYFPQQPEFHYTMSSGLAYPAIEDQAYLLTVPEQSMDTASDSTSGLDLGSPHNSYNQVHAYADHWTNDPSPPPPQG